jgi:alpha-mannosidase
MRITGTHSTDLFTGTVARPLQIVRVTLEAEPAPSERQRSADVAVRIEGAGGSSPHPFRIEGFQGGTYEVPVEVASHVRSGTDIPVTVIAEGDQTRVTSDAMITVAEPGWTMWMVSHFHYDPVWWSTQGQFTEARLVLPDEEGKLPDVRTAFELVQVHLEKARRDPDYKFVLAEVDYLKPYFDVFPAERPELRRLLAEGRVELVGGNYNEANTNLTNAESTIRNTVYGMGYQRDVLGADPASAWMLDVFGHDPGYPGLMAAAGLTSSSWARGPFHQWGPGENTRMQFPSEFEWVSPDGAGLLTGYMANHYGAGWVLNGPTTLAEAEEAAYRQFSELAPAAATRNVLLPVGSDHAIPARWVTDVHRSWNEKYVWPRFVTAIPRDFFDAVRADARDRDVWITPQTRDMNPVYTGKDVSYIDTKQAHRAAEVAVSEAERLASLAALRGARFPAASLDRAWRLLCYGAHHDAITGTESDQVYLDLLAGWREAWQLGDEARRKAVAHLAGSTLAAVGGASGEAADGIAVVNGLARERSGIVTVTAPAGSGVRNAVTGADIPAVAEAAGPDTVALTFRADAVPGLGHRALALVPSAGAAAAWQDIPGATIENGTFRVTADAARGGTVSVTRDGVDVLRGPGNELVLQEEYDKHPRWGEGPWHLSPRGPGLGSASVPAVVRAQRCAAGSRLIATFTLGDLRITQETLLWDGSQRVEFRTHTGGSIGKDRLLRVRFPADVPGGLPVYQTATAVIGRPFGAPEADTAQRWFTLDNPAWQWFGLGAVATVTADPLGLKSAIGVAEVIPPITRNGRGELIRSLVAALAGSGVTATCSAADGPRCGDAAVDSNLPDVRIALGGPDVNPFTAEVLESSPAHAKLLAALIGEHGSARVWVPSALARDDAYLSRGSDSGPDLRGARDLPVLIIAGRDEDCLADEVGAVAGDLNGSGDVGAAAMADEAEWAPPLASRTVAVLNKGTPGGVVSPDGTLWLSLMRACSSWPCGVWIDGDRRAAPDGSSFAWGHWSHTFEYALAAGSGLARTAGFNELAEDYNHPLVAVASGGRDAGASAGVSVSPANVSLTALKPYGNPLASGQAFGFSGDLTVRLRETDGQPAKAVVRFEGGISGAWVTDLLESSRGDSLEIADGAVQVVVPAFGTVTVVVRPAGAAAVDGTAAEAADPEYARYWLHGTGPAPAGNLPVAVHVSPVRVALPSPGDSASVRVSVACGPAPASGKLDFLVPEGLSVTPAGPVPYELPAGDHASWDLTVRADPGAPDGRYFVGAQITGDSGHSTEDAALVAVGEAPPPDRDMDPEELFFRLQADHLALGDEVTLEVLTPAVEVAPGSAAEFRVRVTSRLASELRGVVQLLSPLGSWVPGDEWQFPVRVGAGGSTDLTFPVTAPAGARPGQEWWLLAKLMYFGRVRYSAAAPLTVCETRTGWEPADVPVLGKNAHDA